jgi:hypothetical protein
LINDLTNNQKPIFLLIQTDLCSGQPTKVACKKPDPDFIQDNSMSLPEETGLRFV